MTLASQSAFPSVPRPTSRPGIDRHRPRRLLRPLTQAEVLAEVVPDLTRRIVACIQPIRVILFGSAAKGQMGPASDLDVLVVVADDVDRNEASKTIYRALRGLGFATDIIVVGAIDLALYGNDPWLVYHFALKEGLELYRAEA